MSLQVQTSYKMILGGKQDTTWQYLEVLFGNLCFVLNIHCRINKDVRETPQSLLFILAVAYIFCILFI